MSVSGVVRVHYTGRKPAKLRYIDARRRRYRRRLQLAGVRPASIKRYLARGFVSTAPFVTAVREEMARVIYDMIGRRKLGKRLASAGCRFDDERGEDEDPNCCGDSRCPQGV